MTFQRETLMRCWSCTLLWRRVDLYDNSEEAVSDLSITCPNCHSSNCEPEDSILRRRQMPDDCGCEVDKHGIVYCRMHAEAGEMEIVLFDALKALRADNAASIENLQKPIEDILRRTGLL